MTRLETALREYDGKHVDVLEELRDSLNPDAATLKQVIELVAHDEATIAAGSTWLLRAWIEAGAKFGAPLVKRLSARLVAIEHHWARLHVCQAVGSLAIPASEASAFGAFLETCRTSDKPFLRAWATDGLHRLAARHDEFEGAARRAMEDGLEDPAASVRARVRRIMAGD